MSQQTTIEAPSLVTLTEKAQREIRAIFEREDKKAAAGLRLGVIGGGCSGLSYEMNFGDQRPDDSILDFDGFRVFLDPKSTI